MPRDRFDTGLRQRFQQIVASAFEGEITAFYTHLTDAALARLHLIVKTEPGRIPEVDLAALEQSRSLKYLNIESTQATSAGIASLRRALPTLKIDHN